VIGALVAAAWLAVGVYIWARYRHLIREVVLRRPVLAFESDDWGPGPAEDGARLRELAACACSYRDSRNQPATVTLGVVLAIADTPVSTSEDEGYHRLTLGSERCSPVRQAMLDGVAQGVFFLQLHGAEHYWPPALLAAARRDESVAGWLSTRGIPRTESLPSHLQSRWIDASTLPSKPLEDPAISLAVEDEVRLFEKVFGKAPEVVVPPTFVWNERVERAWVRHGIRVVITPGCRREVRDPAGALEAPTKRIRNGDRGANSGPLYLVRDVYFEPALGHAADAAIYRVLHKARLGLPALVEMHRFNFVDDISKARSSLAEFQRLLELALGALPDLRFLPPSELADAIMRRDPDLIETRLLGRVAVWLRRLWEERRIRWLAFATGAVVPAAVLWFTAGLLTKKVRVGATA